MTKRLFYDPLYTAAPKHLSRREQNRIRRHALAQFNRAAPYPTDQFELERKRRREMLLLDIACGVMFAVIFLMLLAAVIR